MPDELLEPRMAGAILPLRAGILPSMALGLPTSVFCSDAARRGWVLMSNNTGPSARGWRAGKRSKSLRSGWISAARRRWLFRVARSRCGCRDAEWPRCRRGGLPETSLRESSACFRSPGYASRQPTNESNHGPTTFALGISRVQNQGRHCVEVCSLVLSGAR
jgi:hypothetical protein